MAFEEKQKREDPAIEEARKRARWTYIKPFMDEIRNGQSTQEDSVQA